MLQEPLSAAVRSFTAASPLFKMTFTLGRSVSPMRPKKKRR